MKLYSLITCVVLGVTNMLSAQIAVDPEHPTVDFGAVVFTNTAGENALVDFTAQAGLLEVVVEQLTGAYTKAVQGKGGGNPVPTLVYGPGAREARLGAPLHFANLTDVRIVDSLALVAAAAGCNLDPIYSLPQEGDVDGQKRIIGYRFALASDRAPSPSPATGGAAGGGESGTGDQLTGIGVTLGQKDGYIIVSGIIPNSPAARYHGFNLGDRIVQVAEMGQPWGDVTGLPLEKVTKMIMGKQGSTVRLAIDPVPGHGLPELFGAAGGIYFVAIEREKLDPTPPKALLPKVSEVAVPDPSFQVTASGGLDINGFVGNVNPSFSGANLPGGKAGDLVKHPTPAATPDGTDTPVLRLFAVGTILNGNNEHGRKKEDVFKDLVGEAFRLAGLAGDAPPKLFFHSESGVLIAETTARGQEIIEGVANALRKNEESLRQPLPPKP